MKIKFDRIENDVNLLIFFLKKIFLVIIEFSNQFAIIHRD